MKPTDPFGDFEQLYQQLRGVAERYFHREAAGHTLQPTALLHEAFLQLLAHDPGTWRDSEHFRAYAATVMRSVLVDHARARHARKRGGDRQRVTLSAAELDIEGASVDVLNLHQALERLKVLDPLQESIVVLRFFGGLTMDELGRHHGIATRNAERQWRAARAWLAQELRPGPDE